MTLTAEIVFGGRKDWDHSGLNSFLGCSFTSREEPQCSVARGKWLDSGAWGSSPGFPGMTHTVIRDVHVPCWGPPRPVVKMKTSSLPGSAVSFLWEVSGWGPTTTQAPCDPQILSLLHPHKSQEPCPSHIKMPTWKWAVSGRWNEKWLNQKR